MKCLKGQGRERLLGACSLVQVRGDGSDADLGQQWGVPMKA